ncbi:MAG: class I SAM-dependent methyltransferase [bacterium]|nr:class I SAM-dependent methyltransferase [bacterium]
MIAAANPQTVLDIGSGAGKYGRLIRSIEPNIKCIGFEIEQDYIKEFNLKSIYDEIICANISALLDRVDDHFDIAIFGNVLEHLPKSIGTDLLHFLVYRAKLIIINYPFAELQDSYEGHKHEAHISVWSKDDFKQFDFLEVQQGQQRLAVISGFDNDILSLSSVRKICNGTIKKLKFNR